MKKLFLTFAIIFASIGLLGCVQLNSEYSDYTYLSLEMNPAIDFIIDKNDNVHTYQLRNEDAEIVAAGLELEGKNYEEALRLYLNAAIQTGYIDVSRADGAVMIQSGGRSEAKNNAFMIRVENKIQTFFQENAIGAVVLRNSEFDEEVINLAEENNISFGFAKIVLAYMNVNEEAVLEDVLELKPRDIIQSLIDESNQYLNQYRNQNQIQAQIIKDEMISSIQEQVQAHRDGVQNGTITQPDISGLMEQYRNSFRSMHENYVNRNQNRVQHAKDATESSSPMMFSVNINPSIDFLIDEKGYVMSFKLNNEDAEIVAAGLEMVGKHYEEALKLYLNSAIATGYIDVSRSDNAVMIQNSGANSKLENAFMIHNQKMLQKFFFENAIGATCLYQHQIDEEIIAFAEENEISYGYAKLVLTYLATDENLILEEVLLLTSSEIIELLKADFDGYLFRYRNQIEAGARAIKDELIEALRLRVQTHQQDLLRNRIQQPDISGLQQRYLNNYEEIHEGFVVRNQERLQQAKTEYNKKH